MSDTLGRFLNEPIVSVTRIEGNNAIIEPCPFCGKTHRHGNGKDWNDAEPEYRQATLKGYSVLCRRAAHCSGSNDTPDGYYLIYTKNTKGLAWSGNGFVIAGGGEEKNE